jgi:hypothetical protein
MPKLFKYLTFILTFVFTLLTCSGCFDNTTGEVKSQGKLVELATSPANITYREMNEELYIGYLGVQKDFALIVDNLQYNYNNNKGGCKTNDDIGCASMMTQLIMNYGISATQFTGKASDKHVLIYYASASDFANFGNSKIEVNTNGVIGKYNWLDFIAPSGNSKYGSEYSDFNRSENVLKNTCASGTNADICKYAREMASKGYSTEVGNSMILFFHEGDYAGMISDKMLDPQGKLDTASDHDNIVADKSSTTTLYSKYYETLIDQFKMKVSVKDATANNTGKATKRTITQLQTIQELINLVESNVINDYVLLITSNGFLDEKIGNNYKYETIKDALEGNLSDEINSLGGALSEGLDNFMLLFNTVSSYRDNCAYESDVFMNFMKTALEKVIGTALVSVGAATGAAIGAAVGTVIPFIGTVV